MTPDQHKIAARWRMTVLPRHSKAYGPAGWTGEVTAPVSFPGKLADLCAKHAHNLGTRSAGQANQKAATSSQRGAVNTSRPKRRSKLGLRRGSAPKLPKKMAFFGAKPRICRRSTPPPADMLRTTESAPLRTLPTEAAVLEPSATNTSCWFPSRCGSQDRPLLLLSQLPTCRCLWPCARVSYASTPILFVFVEAPM